MYEDIVIFDIEGDSLTPTKIHCLSVKDTSKNPVIRSTTNYDHMRSFFSKPRVLVGHNITLFDIPVIEKLLDIKIHEDSLLVDTLALSWYLYPERNKHGLEAWGEDLGVSKPEIDDWENLTIEKYIHRCEEDVKINTLLWNKMWSYLRKIYDDEESILSLIHI